MTPAQRLARGLVGKRLAIKNGKEGPTPEFVIPVAYAVSSPDSDQEVLVVLERPLPFCSPVFTGTLSDSINPDVFIHSLTVKGSGDADQEGITLTATAPHPWSTDESLTFRVEIVG